MGAGLPSAGSSGGAAQEQNPLNQVFNGGVGGAVNGFTGPGNSTLQNILGGLGGAFGIYNSIQGNNANNQIGGDLNSLYNQYSNLLSGLNSQYGNTAMPLNSQLAGYGSNILSMLAPFLQQNLGGLLNQSMNPITPTAAVGEYNQAIQPWVNSIAGNLWSSGNQAANNAATQFGLQGQPMQGAGGPANAFGGVLQQIPGAIAQSEQQTLPGVQNVFGSALQNQFNAPGNTASILQGLFAQPNSTAGMLNSLTGQQFSGLSGLSNMLQNQQQNNAASQQAGGAGSGFLGGLGGLLGSLGSLFTF